MSRRRTGIALLIAVGVGLSGCSYSSDANGTSGAVAPTAALTSRTDARGRVIGPDGKPSLRIVTLGDSYTEGPGDGGYPARLERLVARWRTGSEVVNVAKSGIDSEALLLRYVPRAEAANPDVAIIYIGTNDLFYDAEKPTKTLDEATEVFRQNLDAIVIAMKAEGTEVFLSPIWDQTLLPVTANLGNDVRTRMSEFARRINDEIALVAVTRNARIVDLAQPLSIPANVAPDGQHPSRTGYDAMADAADQALRAAFG